MLRTISICQSSRAGLNAVVGMRLFHDPAQPPTKVWRAELSDEYRKKLKEIYGRRQLLPNPDVKQVPVQDDKQQQQQQQLSPMTVDALRLIRSQDRLYATVEINTKPYQVTKNDIVVCKRLPNTQIGDLLQLTSVRELGSRDYFIRGQPLVDRRFFQLEALVMEQPESAKYTKYLRRVGKGGGDRKWRKRSYRDNLTVLRITKIDIPSDL